MLLAAKNGPAPEVTCFTKSYTPISAAGDSNCFHANDESILIFLNHVDLDQLSPMKPADQNPQCFHPHNEFHKWTGWKSKHIHNLKDRMGTYL